MLKTTSIKTGNASLQKDTFDPHRLVSDEEFQKNLTAILTYYHMLKKESKRRFASYEYGGERLAS